MEIVGRMTLAEQLIDAYLDMNPNEANGAGLIEYLRKAGFSVMRETKLNVTTLAYIDD